MAGKQKPTIVMACYESSQKNISEKLLCAFHRPLYGNSGRKDRDREVGNFILSHKATILAVTANL
eukprot:scaffold801_cov170-Amphora_coffeaeformis.AAC.4